MVLLVAVAYLVWSDKISIVFNFGNRVDQTEYGLQPGGQKAKTSLLADFLSPDKKNRKTVPEVQVLLPPKALNNVTFAIDNGFAGRNGLDRAEVEARTVKCREYITRFAPVAIAEMHKYGVPASITLAQGLLESNAGDSKLARNANNHFGVKCFSKRCKKGHCLNFTDDSHKDFFVKYNNIWGSYRAHSQFLKNSGRYEHLFDLNRTDYRNWARGLAKAGYATDKKYGEKLIAIIQSLELDQYDVK